MIAVPFAEPQRFVVVGSPGYLAAHDQLASPRDLLTHACIGRRLPSGNRYAWEFERSGQAITIAVSGPLVFDDDELMVPAALDGAGLAYVYESYVKDLISAGRLITVLDEWCETPTRFFLYYPSQRQMPPCLRVFVDAIRSDKAQV
jgi:DNA-binding transcriptional LysR family regulator